VTIFLGRALKAPQIKRVHPSSRTKYWHVVHLRHRDEVEAPITDWLLEAYRLEDAPPPKKASAPKRQSGKKKASPKRPRRS
jgi:hypothetical protein